MTPPVLGTAPHAPDVERDLLQTQERLRRIVAQADRCLVSLDHRARVGRRVRAAARRRAASAAAS